MWYKYLIPRRVFFLNTRPYRWLNFLLFRYPKGLEWKKEGINMEAYIPFTDKKYVVGPVEHSEGNKYCFSTPGAGFGYRPSEKLAMLACEAHYYRNFLGLSGILN